MAKITPQVMDGRQDVSIPMLMAEAFVALVLEQVQVMADILGDPPPPDRPEALQSEQDCIDHLRTAHGITVTREQFREMAGHFAQAMASMVLHRAQGIQRMMEDCRRIMTAQAQGHAPVGALKMDINPLRGEFRVHAAPIGVPPMPPRDPNERGH